MLILFWFTVIHFNYSIKWKVYIDLTDHLNDGVKVILYQKNNIYVYDILVILIIPAG